MIHVARKPKSAPDEHAGDGAALPRIVSYRDRRERIIYLMQHYGRYVQGRVLDVGCDEAQLRAYCPQGYCGLDQHPKADVVMDLETGTLPFKDREFDSIVCTDVLEHLEHCHAVFDEMVRVCRRYLILSLPNCWAAACFSAIRGKGTLKQYGLPLSPPADRHRWFFNYEEAEGFIRGQALRWHLTVRVCEPYYGADAFPKRLLQLCYRFDERRRRNVFARALWAVLERAPDGH